MVLLHGEQNRKKNKYLSYGDSYPGFRIQTLIQITTKI